MANKLNPQGPVNVVETPRDSLWPDWLGLVVNIMWVILLQWQVCIE